MTLPPNPPAPDPTAAEREALLEAWERGESREPAPPRPRGLLARLRPPSWRDEVGDSPGDPDGYVAPPRRATFPPSFLLILAAGLVFLALEPTADLDYALFGPSQAVALGQPGSYALEKAKSGDLVTIQGFATERRATYSQWGREYEVFALAGVPVLVRRPRGPPPPPNTAEAVSVEGRLLLLEKYASTFGERLVRPAARYTPLRLEFAARGELSAVGNAWLVLADDIPRRDASAILVPLALWLGAALLGRAAYRAHRLARRSR